MSRAYFITGTASNLASASIRCKKNSTSRGWTVPFTSNDFTRGATLGNFPNIIVNILVGLSLVGVYLETFKDCVASVQSVMDSLIL